MDEYVFWIIIAALTAFVFGGLFRVVFFPLKLFRKALVIILPVTAVILYSIYGMPDFSDIPQQIQVKESTRTAVEKIEKRLKNGLNQESEIDLELLIKYYKKIQNYQKLRYWYEQLYALKQDNDIFAELVEARILEANGIIDQEIASDLEHKFKENGYQQMLIPYYLGLYHLQNDDLDQATLLFQNIITESYVDDPWIPDIVDALKFVAKEKDIDPSQLLKKPKLMR